VENGLLSIELAASGACALGAADGGSETVRGPPAKSSSVAASNTVDKLGNIRPQRNQNGG
jgi:hypothetical protein